MSVATPTVLPRSSLFPDLLQRAPQPHPTPLPHYGHRPGRLNSRRDLNREMDDLSDEENELEDINIDIRNRGFTFLVPIGRTYTQHEEKNDADEPSDGDSDESGETGDEHSMTDEGENDSDEDEHEEDLDADMEDLDDEVGNASVETADQSGSIDSADEYEDDEDDEDD